MSNNIIEFPWIDKGNKDKLRYFVSGNIINGCGLIDDDLELRAERVGDVSCLTIRKMAIDEVSEITITTDDLKEFMVAWLLLNYPEYIDVNAENKDQE